MENRPRKVGGWRGTRADGALEVRGGPRAPPCLNPGSGGSPQGTCGLFQRAGPRLHTPTPNTHTPHCKTGAKGLALIYSSLLGRGGCNPRPGQLFQSSTPLSPPNVMLLFPLCS